jgi:predicted nucleotidyltransferase
MPAEKARMLNDIVDRLRSVPNVVAVVLGGSFAQGLARPESDVDIGLYYRQASPFPVDHVRSVAESICLPGSTPTVTNFYEWGLG